MIKLYSKSATHSHMPTCVVLVFGGGYCIFIVALAEKVTEIHFALTAVSGTICKTD